MAARTFGTPWSLATFGNDPGLGHTSIFSQASEESDFCADARYFFGNVAFMRLVNAALSFALI
jgi:hypothetical protein